MIRRIDIDIAPTAQARWLIAPRPIPYWGQRFETFEAGGVDEIREIKALNSRCRAYLLRVEAERPARISYALSEGEASVAEWFWRTQESRYMQASPSLIELAQHLAEGATSQRMALRRIAEEAAAVFAYDHPEERFNDGCADVPRICGTTKGSCVDINTYILAAALSLGIRGQYVMGYWFHPHRTQTPDGHCWLAFEPDGELVFWDVAHALKWADSLGARLGEGLNPAGGRRVAMSCGRGLTFDTPLGPVEISHFSDPMTVLGEGRAEHAEIGPVRLTETAAEAA